MALRVSGERYLGSGQLLRPFRLPHDLMVITLLLQAVPWQSYNYIVCYCYIVWRLLRWCTFEVAAFLRKKDAKRIRIMPAPLAFTKRP